MGTRVLIVDADERFSSELTRNLGGHGFVVSCVPRGEDAIAFIREQATDVVLLNVALPGGQVLDILREIKLVGPLTQVIMLAGEETVDVAIRGMKLGAYDCIVVSGQRELIEEKINKARALKSAQEERIKRAEVDRLVMKREW
ncbi:MAG: response regulator [Desulfomonile sp.]|nr:response regulator [Desulfomonile sp.]